MTARPVTLVKLAETLVCDWLNANERQKNGDVNNHIAEDLFFTDDASNRLWNVLLYSTDYDQWLTLESWFTNLEQTPLNH